MEGIKDFLKERQEKGLLRKLRPADSRTGGKISFDAKEYIDFSSNDYLGLSGHPLMKKAACDAIEKWGVSSSASRLLSGDSQVFHSLEKEVAEFKGKESALIFNSGYQANIGIISALYKKQDCIFCDRLAHASIIDAILFSQAKLFRFKHNDTDDLKALLEKERKNFKNALVVTESVFSMDGDIAPLKEIVKLKGEHNCQLMVDEAHATGIFGKNGSGLVEEEGLSGQTDLIMGTFSKALGSFGAYLAASKEITDYLVNTCRSFIYSTALPSCVIAANLVSIELIKREPERRTALLSLAGFLRDKLKEKGFSVRGSSQIVPVIIGDNFKALEFAERLKEKSFWVMAVRPPTVPDKEARLRISLSCLHKKEDLKRLADAIAEVRI